MRRVVGARGAGRDQMGRHRDHRRRVRHEQGAAELGRRGRGRRALGPPRGAVRDGTGRLTRRGVPGDFRD